MRNTSSAVMEKPSGKVHWAQPPVVPHHPNPASPAAVSAPIPMPDCKDMLHIAPHKLGRVEKRSAGPDRIHSRLDNVTDYNLRGTHGWEHAHEERSQRLENETGRITTGFWLDRRFWE
jgi:hypothetical protein